MCFSRYRFLAGALILLLIGILLRVVVTKTEAGRAHANSRVEKSESSGVAAGLPLALEEGAGRSREPKASAKLRSLLNVREGELGMIRIPAGKAAEGLGVSLGGPGQEWDSATILNVADIGRFSKDLEARVSRDDLVEGAVKAADGSFEWRSSDLEIKGEGLPNSKDEITLRLSLRIGNHEVLTTFTAKAGTMFVVYPGKGAEEAVLMVVGGEDVGGNG